MNGGRNYLSSFSCQALFSGRPDSSVVIVSVFTDFEATQSQNRGIRKKGRPPKVPVMFRFWASLSEARGEEIRNNHVLPVAHMGVSENRVYSHL